MTAVPASAVRFSLVLLKTKKQLIENSFCFHNSTFCLVLHFAPQTQFLEIMYQKK